MQIFRFRIVECEDFDPECKKMNKILFAQAGFFNNKFDVFMPKTS